MKNNKKGFTLIELLAVIVVLAIIMVIATGQVTKTINDARRNSFTSSFKMLEKEFKRKMAENDLMSDTNEYICTADKCSTMYDISAADYTLTVSEVKGAYTSTVNEECINGDKVDGSTIKNCIKKGSVGSGTDVIGYEIKLVGKGKFSNVDYSTGECPVSKKLDDTHKNECNGSTITAYYDKDGIQFNN